MDGVALGNSIRKLSVLLRTTTTRHAEYKSVIEIVDVPDAIAGPTPSLLCTCLGLPRYRHKCWSLWSGSHRSTRSIRWALSTRWAYSARVQFLNLKSKCYRMVLTHKNWPISIFVQIKNWNLFRCLFFPNQPSAVNARLNCSPVRQKLEGRSVVYYRKIQCPRPTQWGIPK